MLDTKERAAFTLSQSVKAELETQIPKSKRSQFVEKAIAKALEAEAKRRAIESLEELPCYETKGEDSVAVLRNIRANLTVNSQNDRH